MLPLEAPLFLLGNDIFGNNEEFAFVGLKTNRKKPILEFLNKRTLNIVDIICESGPS